MKGYGRKSDGLDAGILLMTQTIEQVYEQSQKKHVKKKMVKQLKQQVTNEQDQVKSKGNAEENKVYTAQQERKKQFDNVEAKHNQELKANQEEINRLREAMILAEIIGKPRCKMKQNGRVRRI